jgi:hypothetical protein
LTYESAENINSDFLIRSIDDFSSYLEKPTVLVLDNAPTHRSEKFLAAVERWIKGLITVRLPKFKKKVKAIFNNIGLGIQNPISPDDSLI